MLLIGLVVVALCLTATLFKLGTFNYCQPARCGCYWDPYDKACRPSESVDDYNFGLGPNGNGHCQKEEKRKFWQFLKVMRKVQYPDYADYTLTPIQNLLYNERGP